MQMARTPVQPTDNIPQAIVDFVRLLKDPEWLKSHVEAANAIHGANKLTEEEAENLVAAQATMKAAREVGTQQREEWGKIAEAKKLLEAAQVEVTKREKQCDDRNTQHAAVLAAHQESTSKLVLDQKELNGRVRVVKSLEVKHNTLAAELAARESAVAKRESALRKANEMVTGG